MCVCSAVFDSATPWTVALEAPLSMEFSRRDYWSNYILYILYIYIYIYSIYIYNLFMASIPRIDDS